MKPQRIRLFDAIVFTLLVAVAFHLYRRGIVSIPRGDHIDVLIERRFYSSELEYFWNLLSFNRTRHLNAGDYLLFRPGLFFILGVEDIFSRANLFIAGAVSIALHAVTAFALYLLARTVANWRIAAVAAIFFLVQFSGMEMIMWRHVSPYMLSLVFFAFGLREVSLGAMENRQRAIRAAMFFFASMLFHEFPLICLAVCAALFLLMEAMDKKQYAAISIIFVAPVLIYMGTSLVDYFYRNPEIIHGVVPPMAEHPSLAYAIVYTSGIFAVSFVAPGFVAFTGMATGRARWDMSLVPSSIAEGLGIILIVIVIGAVASVLVKFWKGERTGWIVASTVLAITVMVVLFGIALGRVYPRGMDYLMVATYDFYLFSFLATLGAVFAIARLKRPWIAVTCLAFVMTPLLLMNYRGIQQTLKAVPSFYSVAQITRRVPRILNDFGLCLERIESSDYPFHPSVFYRETCEVKAGKPAVLRGTLLNYRVESLHDGRQISVESRVNQ